MNLCRDKNISENLKNRRYELQNYTTDSRLNSACKLTFDKGFSSICELKSYINF